MRETSVQKSGKKIRNLFLFVFSACFLLSSCGSKIDKSSSSISPSVSLASPSMPSTAVIYFSCTNNTKKIADMISENLSASAIRIVPKDPYTSADLDYSDSSCRADREQNDPDARPAIANTLPVSSYSVIFLGYPIWWGTLPKIIYTLCDTYDFSKRTLIPFCTSGSSGIETSISALKSLEPDADFLPGRRFSSSASQAEVDSWIKSLSLIYY
jgi:flavodoxin